MDILSKYQQEHPEAFREKPAAIHVSDEYGFFIRTVMRVSGGRIQTMRQATRALAGIAVIILLAALIMIYFALRDTRPAPSAADLRLTPPSLPAR